MVDLSILIQSELTGLYGAQVNKEQRELIKLYEFYEGPGQLWDTAQTLDYTPTKLRTNITKKLIKEEARFMFGRTPEIRIKAKDKKNENSCKVIEDFVWSVLRQNNIKDKLIKGARDCFIARRVALKLWGSAEEKTIKAMFRPSLEFIFETDPDDIDVLNKIIFFYSMNNAQEKSEQRIWKQKYEMINDRCILNEGIYDGHGQLIEEKFTDYNTGLDFIPVKVIINDGLTGDLKGESDIDELSENQDTYNRLKSDDIDALKFNMFPQRVATDAAEKSLKNIKVAPGALVDLQSEGLDEGKQAKMEMLESSFTYDQRFENSINRVKNDMYELLNIPQVSLEQLKGLIQSGKSMKALYWQLISRCEEKWCVWEPAMIWMVESIIKMAKFYRIANLPELSDDDDYVIELEHLYPIMEDEETERQTDLEEVIGNTRSIRGYMEKWNVAEEPDAELQRILEEKELLGEAGMDMFQKRALDELKGGSNAPK